MATLRKRKNKTWQINWINPFTGKRERTSFRNKDLATKILNEYVIVEKLSKSGFSRSVISEITGNNSEETLTTIWEWYEHNRCKELNVNTVNHYRYAIDSFIDVYGENMLISGIKTFQWRKYRGISIYKEMMKDKLSQTSINTYLSKVSTIFNAAVEDGLIHSNPIILKKDKIKRITDAKPIKVWTREEIKIIMDHKDVSLYDKLVFMFIALSGVRMSEICGVHIKKLKNGQRYDCGFYWDNVLWDKNAIVIYEKGKYDEHTIRYISPLAISILKAIKNKYGDVAPIPYGKQHLRNLVERIANTTGVSFTIHDIRRLTGQVVVDVTGDLTKAQELYGHTDIDITRQSYADYTDKQKSEVAKQVGNELEEYLSITVLEEIN
tara:strand:- start:8611 stop:9750 length:1140 start_codon:yes stop_codon:yes gene_type:complete